MLGQLHGEYPGGDIVQGEMFRGNVGEWKCPGGNAPGKSVLDNRHLSCILCTNFGRVFLELNKPNHSDSDVHYFVSVSIV